MYSYMCTDEEPKKSLLHSCHWGLDRRQSNNWWLVQCSYRIGFTVTYRKNVDHTLKSKVLVCVCVCVHACVQEHIYTMQTLLGVSREFHSLMYTSQVCSNMAKDCQTKYNILIIMWRISHIKFLYNMEESSLDFYMYVKKHTPCINGVEY